MSEANRGEGSDVDPTERVPPEIDEALWSAAIHRRFWVVKQELDPPADARKRVPPDLVPLLSEP